MAIRLRRSTNVRISRVYPKGRIPIGRLGEEHVIRTQLAQRMGVFSPPFRNIRGLKIRGISEIIERAGEKPDTPICIGLST